MCNTFAIATKGNTILITTPFNPRFVDHVKAAGARWNADEKAWTMDVRDLETAREIMRRIYGRDDQPCELVSARVTFLDDIQHTCGPVVICGRIVASAKGRDTGARVGEGVCLEKGQITSGGSTKNWHTEVCKGAVLVIHDLPRALAENRAASDAAKIEDRGWKLEIIDAAPAVDVAALTAERDRLIARLTEIDAALGNTTTAAN